MIPFWYGCGARAGCYQTLLRSGLLSSDIILVSFCSVPASAWRHSDIASPSRWLSFWYHFLIILMPLCSRGGGARASCAPLPLRSKGWLRSICSPGPGGIAKIKRRGVYFSNPPRARGADAPQPALAPQQEGGTANPCAAAV